MTASVNYFALIGRSFPIDAFKDLHNASMMQRAGRRMRLSTREAHVWRASSEPIVVPARLLS